MTARPALFPAPIQAALDAIIPPATPAIPAALRSDLIALEAEYHAGYTESRDQREWQHTRGAQAIEARVRDALEDVSKILFRDRWALLETFEEVVPSLGVVEAGFCLATNDDWVPAWLAAARRYAEGQ